MSADHKRTAIAAGFSLLPRYPKTPHLPHSKLTAKDDLYASDAELAVLLCSKTMCVEEKLDGANVRIHWDGKGDLLVGNRDHVLHKGYLKKETPAKLQFCPLWNWIYDHRRSFARLTELCQGTPAIYGEWLYAEHTIKYDKLPSLLAVFGIMINNKFLDPIITRQMVSLAGLTNPPLVSLNNGTIAQDLLDTKSYWGDELREGVYIKCGDGRFNTGMFKYVRSTFAPRNDFNESELKRNTLNANAT